MIRECDDLFSKIRRIEVGQCEVHNKRCANLGVSHILPKGLYDRIRYSNENTIVCGWFCSHYWSHMDTQAPRSLQYHYAVKRKLGENWRDKLLILNATSRPLQTFYLEELKFGLTQCLKVLQNGESK